MQYFLGGFMKTLSIFIKSNGKMLFFSVKVYIKNEILDSVCVKCDFTHPEHFLNGFYVPCIEQYYSIHVRKMILYSCYYLRIVRAKNLTVKIKLRRNIWRKVYSSKCTISRN